MTNNFILYSSKIIGGLFLEIAYFPLWWYSHGVLNLFWGLLNYLKDKEKGLAFSVWLKNIFTPMYGQYNLIGYFISFIVRFFQVVVRGLALVIYFLVAFIMLMVWLGMPVLALYEAIYQLI